ncbi:MAG: ferrochelatase [Mariprofundaceae bacterium]|nr:ferrochelatase [Mariprofundaceae bacterium]
MPDQTPVGILLSNLGTPDAPTTPALRRYLKEFLWDKRVVDLPRPLWWLILNGIILNTRPQRSAKSYQKVWTENGSPLMDISLRQQAALQAVLDANYPDAFHVELAMRYGNPSIAYGMQKLAKSRCNRVLVLPLYPQYSLTTTESTFDAVDKVMKTDRDMPKLHLVRNYHDHPAYIAALAASIREDMEVNGPPDKLLFSFHGIPKRYYENGDPYPDECHRTAELLAEALELEDNAWMLTFQSRFGREEWMQPYTDKTLQRLPQQGVKNVAVVCPGFAADCLETLEEISIQNRKFFMDAGGKSFRYIPALNDREDHIRTLADIVHSHCADWL